MYYDHSIDYHQNGITINVKNRKRYIFPPYTYILEYNSNIKNDNVIRYTEADINKNLNSNYRFQCDILSFIPKNVIPSPSKYNVEYEYSVQAFLQESIYVYLIIVDICRANHIDGVIDIGCASGIASFLFNLNSINYLGIDNRESNRFFPYALCNYPLSDNARITNMFQHKSINQLHTAYANACYPYMFTAISQRTNSVFSNINTQIDLALISVHCMFYIIDEIYSKQLKPLLHFKNSIILVPNDVKIEQDKNLLEFMDINVIYNFGFSKLIHLKHRKI